MKPKPLWVLIVEDSPELAASLAMLFESQGHRIDFASDGVSGLQLALEQAPDVLILDLGLPRLDGIALCRELRRREERHTPVLMLTARDAMADKLKGFEAGADDYLVKPFSGEELLARCMALSHRRRLGEQHRVQLGSLVLDRRTGLAQRDGRPLRLNHISQQILKLLVESHPRALTRSALIERIWGDEAPPSDPLRTHLYLLRRELDPPGARPMLTNIHGVGYRLQADG